MNSILFVNACVRERSRTRRLAAALLSKLQGEIFEMNLEQLDLHPFTRDMLDRRDALRAANDFGDFSFDIARRFAKADVIVFAAPYWDCSFPASVKAFVEHVMVQGLAFTYTEEGFPKGLCRAKQIYYVSTAGGPVVGEHLGFSYIRTLAEQYWGIPEVKLFQAENLDVLGADPERILQDAISNMGKELL